MISGQKYNIAVSNKTETTTDFKESVVDKRFHTNTPDGSNEQIAKIIQQFDYRDIKVAFVKQIAATRTMTYFFELDEHRLNDIVRIDNTMRRILEIALETSGISILAPVPETSQVAVIVPKKECEPIRLSNFIKEIEKYKHKIPFVLGEDHLGQPKVIDLAKCHHQLIAGATGSGKSNSLKAIITAIALTCDHKHLKLLLVDGKGIDLVAFDKIPHLLCPVITERKKAINALKWLHQEMEQRRVFLQQQNISDIWTYNEQCVLEIEEQSNDLPEPLPAILLIVDEVQVLMNGKNEEAESLLQKITQQGRACGIIVVLSTQRPSVDIIQGSIKINLPGRIAFSLPSNADSRVILDQPGAELLRAKGDLLAIESSFSKTTRLQAPLVTDNEIKEMCSTFEYQEEDSLDIGTKDSCKTTLNEHIIQSNSENANQGESISSPLKITHSDTMIYQIPILKFAKVCVKYNDIATWITKKYPDRSWQIELVYFPFLYGQVRENFNKFKILYDARYGRFVRYLVPSDTVEVNHLFEGLNGELEVFSCLRNANSQFIAAEDIIISDEKDAVTKDVYITTLIEKGLVGASPRGYFIQKDFARVPRLSGKLYLTEVPEIPSKQTTVSDCSAIEVVEQLRVQLWKIWQATLEKYVYIGLPTYRAVSTQDDILMFPACSSIWKLKLNHFFSHLERFHFNANIEINKDAENEV